MAPVDRNAPTRARSSESNYSLMEFMREFPDDATCLEWLWRSAYSEDGKHAYCPKCERERSFHRVKSRPSYSCDSCGHHLHPTAGTIYHKSSTSLHLWFYAIYLMSQTRCGISAKQLERELGVTYKTAWRMFTLIRNRLMDQDEGPLTGEVEADEMFVGGKLRESERRALRAQGITNAGPAAKKRAVVVGMVERGGKVRASTVPSRSHARGVIHEFVLPGSIVYTDDWGGYAPLSDSPRYLHKRINHSAKVYVEGDVHTQTIEGFFGLVKNAIRGVHHGVSHKWLEGYLNEYAWRWNHRDDRRAQFESLLLRAIV